MTDPSLVVDYRRSGGRPPADDERIAIGTDGRFVGRRTVGGRRIGTFAGRLADEDLAAVTRLAAAVADDLEIATPRDGATETIQVSAYEARMGSNERPDGAWGELTRAVRQLLDDQLITAPVAALELQVSEGRTALSFIGEGAMEIDEASISTRTVRLSGDGAVLGRGGAAAAPARPEDSGPRRQEDWTPLEPGWSRELDIGSPLELESGDWLQTWAFARTREEGTTRAARLFVARQA